MTGARIVTPRASGLVRLGALAVALGLWTLVLPAASASVQTVAVYAP
jgi:hypothetical protein